MQNASPMHKTRARDTWSSNPAERESQAGEQSQVTGQNVLRQVIDIDCFILDFWLYTRFKA